MAVVRFGDVAGTTGFPSESDFRKAIGRSGWKQRFTSSNTFLDQIYVHLRRAQANPNDMMAMRKLRAACAKWVNNKGVGEYDSGTPTPRQNQIVILGLAASNRFYLLVNRFYLDRGRQTRLDARIAKAEIDDDLLLNLTGSPLGKKLGKDYRMERHTTKHVSNHIAAEKDWKDYKQKHKSRLGFEDWVESIAIPDREDNIGTLDKEKRKGSAAELRRGVQYMDEDGRSDYRLICFGARLAFDSKRTIADGNPLPARYVHTANMRGSSGPSFGIFVMDFHRNIYVARPASSRFHHSTFLGGSPVLAAGEIAVQNGTVRGVTNKTGHYRAGRQELLNTLRVLQSMGVSLEKAVVQDRGLKQSKWRKPMDVIRAHGNFDDPRVMNTPEQPIPMF